MSNTYLETLERLFRSNSSQDRLNSLEISLALNSALDAPANSYPCIHIAGSNGKGSVAYKIAKALELSGYRVGLYTSPHLYCFRERIGINGKKISEEDVVSGAARLFAMEIKAPSFFELVTFLALDYFRKEKVDVAVIETGIGGKWDPTNVIPSKLAVITSISREHVQLLGGELDQIAEEKAGILKEGIPAILGPNARLQPIYDRASKLGAPLYISKKISHFYDEENSAIARLALDHLPDPLCVDSNAVEVALTQRPPCRFEIKEGVIFDVAHNPDAIFHLLQALHTFYPQRKFRFVVGFSQDKDYELCLELIAGVATHIHLVQASIPRAASLRSLEEAVHNQASSPCTLHPSVEEGVKQAFLQAREKGEQLVVCGSFFIMQEAAGALYAPNEKILLSSAVS